jgi:hypothetical protein
MQNFSRFQMRLFFRAGHAPEYSQLGRCCVMRFCDLVCDTVEVGDCKQCRRYRSKNVVQVAANPRKFRRESEQKRVKRVAGELSFRLALGM